MEIRVTVPSVTEMIIQVPESLESVHPSGKDHKSFEKGGREGKGKKLHFSGFKLRTILTLSPGLIYSKMIGHSPGLSTSQRYPSVQVLVLISCTFTQHSRSFHSLSCFNFFPMLSKADNVVSNPQRRMHFPSAYNYDKEKRC